jgi:hypothetical protein
LVLVLVQLPQQAEPQRFQYLSTQISYPIDLLPEFLHCKFRSAENKVRSYRLQMNPQLLFQTST